MRHDLHAARVWCLRDVEWAKQLSFSHGEYRDRSDANARREPDSLTPLEIQFQLSLRIGRGRRESLDDDASWAVTQAREFGSLLASLKKRLGPRDFEGWLRAFCLFSPRTAARYMRIAREWGSRPVETSRVEFDCSWRGRWVRDRVTLESAERSFAEPPPAQAGGDA
jgi:hypothetical protein